MNWLNIIAQRALDVQCTYNVRTFYVVPTTGVCVYDKRKDFNILPDFSVVSSCRLLLAYWFKFLRRSCFKLFLSSHKSCVLALRHTNVVNHNHSIGKRRGL